MSTAATKGSQYRPEFDLSAARATKPAKTPAAHQREALGALGKWYAKKADARGAILALPTGGGKTYTAVQFVCAHPLSDGFKVLWLAHTHHLLDQALYAFADGVAAIGEPKQRLAVRVVSGGNYFPVHSIRDDDDVVIGSLQAIAKAIDNEHPRLADYIRSTGGKLMVVFDEAHHAPAPTYRRLLQRLRDQFPGMVLLGLTATPTYSDERKRGWLSTLFPQGIVHQVTLNKLMATRVLAKPQFEEARTDFEPNFTDAEYRAWVGSNLDVPENVITKLAQDQARNEYVVGYYAQHRGRFGKTIIFADRVAQCIVLCKMLESRGVKAGAVFSQVANNAGTTVEERNQRPSDENHKVLDAFRRDELDVVVNVRMLTEGTDVPKVDTVFLTRQTTSQILMTQMVGRALRGPKFGGTEKANIVLFIDNWKQQIHWAEFDELTVGGTDDADAAAGRRPPLQLISISLLRRLAAQMDSGGNVNDVPFQSYLPVGWFRVDYGAEAGTEEESAAVRQMVLAYEHDKPHYDDFIAAMDDVALKPFEEASVHLADVRPQVEAWAETFFGEADEQIGTSLANDLYLIASHMAKNGGVAPRFFLFADRDKHDLDRLAQEHVDNNLGPLTVNDQLRDEHKRQDRFWGVIYPHYGQFKNSYDGCLNRILNPPPPIKAVENGPIVDPDPGPTEEVKAFVKQRDGYRCLCCGMETRKDLQIDHIDPQYYGGSHEPANLQTLCVYCNSAKGDLLIDFRERATLLRTPPTAGPKWKLPPLPPADPDRDLTRWSRLLQRWVNFFYQCAAVDHVDVGFEAGRANEWAVALVAGINPKWAQPHLNTLTRQIGTAMAEAGDRRAPERITIYGPTGPDQDTSITLDDVLATIQSVEGFRVVVENLRGRKVRGSTAGGIAPYPCRNALNGERTVADWKALRLFKTLEMFNTPEYVVQVLDGNGDPCSGQRKLRTVRESYP